MSSDKKDFKWQVKPGGTLPPDTLNIKAATDQTGSTSIVKSLAVSKAEGSHTITTDSLSVKHATSVPDSKFSQVEFAKGSGESHLDSNSTAIKAALNAPTKPVAVNAVDKTQVVRNNTSSY